MRENTDVIKVRNAAYNKYVNNVTPKTNIAKAIFHSFAIGGITCVIGQAIGDIVLLIAPDTRSEERRVGKEC